MLIINTISSVYNLIFCLRQLTDGTSLAGRQARLDKPDCSQTSSGFVSYLFQKVNPAILLIIILTSASLNYSQIFLEKDLESGITYIVNYINSEKFKDLKNGTNDLELVDSLYKKTLSFYNNDISETLLALTFSTLPFIEMPLQIPIIKLNLSVTLPAGPPSKLNEKIENLPKNIFFDSPKTNFGDKDKLAHFFGNAYLAYSIRLFNMSKFLSILVELFEDAFKVEGQIDYRDFIANTFGYQFGMQLRNDEDYLPSQALQAYSIFFMNYFYP